MIGSASSERVGVRVADLEGNVYDMKPPRSLCAQLLRPQRLWSGRR